MHFLRMYGFVNSVGVEFVRFENNVFDEGIFGEAEI